VGRDASTVGRGLEENDHTPDGRRPPSEAIEDDPRNQPLLDIEPSDRVIDGGELGLHLNHQRCPVVRAGGEDIDRSAVAEFVEGHLDLDVPSSNLEPPAYRPDQRCVALIEQAVDRAASPREHAFVPCLDRRADGTHGSTREAGEMSAFGERYERLRDIGFASDVELAAALAKPQSPDETAKPNVVHSTMVVNEALLRLTRVED